MKNIINNLNYEKTRCLKINMLNTIFNNTALIEDEFMKTKNKHKNTLLFPYRTFIK